MAIPKESLPKDSIKSLKITTSYVSVFEDENNQWIQAGHDKLKNEPNKQKKKQELEDLAVKNSPAAMYDLATCHLHGYLGIKQDASKALEFTYQAAQFDYAFACFSLAEHCMPKKEDKSKKSNGKDRNSGKDEKISADRPDYLVDARYEYMAPTDSNYRRWLNKATKKGLGIAECHLALWYKNHPEVEGNLILAKHLFQSASSAKKGAAISKMALNALKKFFPEKSNEGIQKMDLDKPEPDLEKPGNGKAPLLFSALGGMAVLNVLLDLQQHKKDREFLLKTLDTEQALLKHSCDKLKSQHGKIPDTLLEQQKTIVDLTEKQKQQIKSQINNKRQLEELRNKLKNLEKVR